MTLDTIKKYRTAIRNHRDQVGDDRCWVDDWSVWSVLEGSKPEPQKPPSFEEAMRCCRSFWIYRKSALPEPQHADAITDPAHWDDDLKSMNDEALKKEEARIEKAIKIHRDIDERERTIDDDRVLYAILPEKIVADFRLPTEDEFLGEKRAPHAGCPSFWRSHQGCACEKHNLHTWGPCKC